MEYKIELMEEEKEAIKHFKNYENKLVYEINENDKKYAKTLLNLIDKLQNENTELKDDKEGLANGYKDTADKLDELRAKYNELQKENKELKEKNREFEIGRLGE